MLKKIAKLIRKVRERYKNYTCYKIMNKNNSRTYIKEGICAGLTPYEQNEVCEACPYFQDIRDNDDWS